MGLGIASDGPDIALTDEQREVVEWPEGPLVVIAAAGTGKTRVIVERVRWLLATDRARTGAGPLPPEAATLPAADPFEGPLLPEQILILTYNVRAAQELGERLEAAIGAPARARLAVSNFHSFCHRVLTESATDAGLPSRPDVIDGVGQVLLLRDLRPGLPLVYFAGGGNPYWNLQDFVAFINRAKDELVSPDDFEVFVAREREVFETRYGEDHDEARARLATAGKVTGVSKARGEYAKLRAAERAADAGDGTADPDPRPMEKVADLEARRAVVGTGRAPRRDQLTAEQRDHVDVLAATYVRDGAALEVLRLSELALVYRAYQAELARRGVLDFGEQIARVATLFRERPNVLRRYQRQYRHILVDEFQDANIAQIELIEMLGRTPDRPDNVMVVGDDDQSIYRFRGASFAAFAEFDRRFSGPPAHDPHGHAPGSPPRRRIEANFRSRPPILEAANRLIARNELRFDPDKRLVPSRDGGSPVELIRCDGPDDEAAAIVERIADLADWRPGRGGRPARPWSSFAVLYRKHRHRDAIVARLRESDIPYVVSGGLSLFATPEVRDLEQTLRAVVDPLADASLARMLSGAPWRLDALELLRLTRMAKRGDRHLVDVIHEVIASGAVEVERPDEARPAEGEPVAVARTAQQPIGASLLARLRQAIGALDELNALAWREGPHTILERLLERTGRVGDLLALDTLESRRELANTASLLRFAADWQREHPTGSLAAFVDYLDAYQAAGGELPTSVEAIDDAQGVRLMTLHQAKGLEYDTVFVPCLVAGEWPVRVGWAGLFPRELLREQVPTGDVHTEEERRLLYVAMTRARERLILTTQAGTLAKADPSVFVGELEEGAGPELVAVDRAIHAVDEVDAAHDGEEEDPSEALGAVLALPSPRERRHALRVRATELITLLEATDPAGPDAASVRAALLAEVGRVAESALVGADEARAAGLDPLTLRILASDAGAGGDLFSVAPLPTSFSYTSLDRYGRCPLRYALADVYRLPGREAVPALSFGTIAHTAFETFTRERRERAARGEPAPDRGDLERWFAASWDPAGFPDRTSEDTYRRRVASMLDTFWSGELASAGEAVHEELAFELRLDPPDGSAPVVLRGKIDRIDRLPSGGLEVVDYKTGSSSSQKSVDESLQLSIYALACRDVLGLGAPERVTLYFTEEGIRRSTTRTDAQLDAARDQILATVAAIRSGAFAATPSEKACGWCDYRALCPSRVG